MSDRDAIMPLMPAVPTGQATKRTTFNLPPELLKKGRQRLGFLAGLIAILCIFSTGLEALIGSETTRMLYGVFAIVFGLSTAIFFLSRAKVLSHSLILKLGLIYEVLMCLTISTGFIFVDYIETGRIIYLSWICIWIVVFPLIIPCPPRLTLVTATLAAATAPLSVLILRGLDLVVALPFDYLNVSVSPLLCTVVAYAGSRVVHGLNVAVAEARQMGSYQLTEQLGQGGMGEVWLAKHKMLARPAAVKLISAESLATTAGGAAETLTQRFEREAQATAQLESEHTVNIFDFGVTDDGSFYYVMERLKGQDLDDLVKKYGSLNPERAIHILTQVCHSLAEAHHNGLIHRDIKPANIYLCVSGLDHDFVKVLDFGLVKGVFDSGTKDSGLTIDGNITGTPAFIPPEIATGQGETDGRSDIYSLGCVAYWLLTGQLLFEAETPLQVIMKHVASEPVRLSARCELDLPAGLEDVVHACLEKDPAQRPQTAQELADRLAAIELENPWTQERARNWWEKHRQAQTE
jgi:eukaryotic-like serine/threonine-protein kinase